MRPLAAVVRSVGGEHAAQVSYPKISIRSVSSARTVNTKRSAKQFARGHRGGILTTSIPVGARNAAHVTRPADTRGAAHRAGRAVGRYSDPSSSAGGWVVG